MWFKITSLFIVVLLLFAGCINIEGSNVKEVFDYQVTEEEGITVEINSVKYVTNPGTKWENQQLGDFFGYAGDEKKKLYIAENDEAKNFLFIYDSALCPFGDTQRILMYKKGLPNPSGKNIDKLHWGEYKNKDGELEYSYDNTVTDKSLITELFGEWETQDKIFDVSFFGNESAFTIMYISCYSRDIKGANYDMDIKHYKESFVLGNNLEGYVYISEDLLKKISGHEIQVDEYMN